MSAPPLPTVNAAGQSVGSGHPHVPRLPLPEQMRSDQGQPHSQFPPHPPQRPAMQQSHRTMNREDGINVSFPLTIERALRFRTYAESNQQLITELQKFGIHSIRFQGLPSKDHQHWRPQPAGCHLPAYPPPRPNVMPYQQRMVNFPDERPPRPKKPRTKSINHKAPPLPPSKVPPGHSSAMPSQLIYPQNVIRGPGQFQRPPYPSAVMEHGPQRVLIHQQNGRFIRTIRNVSAHNMIPLTPDNGQIINQVPIVDQNVQVVQSVQPNPMFMTPPGGPPTPCEPMSPLPQSMAPRSPMNVQEGIPTSVPTQVPMLVPPQTPKSPQVPPQGAAQNPAQSQPHTMMNPSLASSTNQCTQPILPHPSPSHELPADDPDELYKLMSDGHTPVSQGSRHEDSESAKQNILNFLLSNSNNFSADGTLPQNGDKEQSSPALSSNTPTTGSEHVFKKPPPPKQKSSPA